MADFRIREGKFDGSYCTVDSFRHLLSESQAVNHLRNVAGHLKKGSIYVLGLYLLPRSGFKQKIFRWQGSRGQLTVYSSITVLEVNRNFRRETLKYTLRVGNQKHSSVYQLRTYTLQQFMHTLKKAGCFEITDVFDLDYDVEKPVYLDSDSEEMVCLLKKI